MRIPASLGRLAPGLAVGMALGAVGLGWLLSPTELGARLRRAHGERAGTAATLTHFGHGMGYAGTLREFGRAQDPLGVLTQRARVSLPPGVGEPALMARRLPPYLYAPREYTAALGDDAAARIRALAVTAPVRRPPAAAGVDITAAQALTGSR